MRLNGNKWGHLLRTEQVEVAPRLVLFMRPAPRRRDLALVQKHRSEGFLSPGGHQNAAPSLEPNQTGNGSFCCPTSHLLGPHKPLKRKDFHPYLQSCGCRRRRRWASWRCAPWNSGPPSLPAAGCVTASARWVEARRGWPEERGEWGGWQCGAEPSQCCRGGRCCRSHPTAAPSCCRCCSGRSCRRSCCGCSWSWRTGSAWASAAETRRKELKRNWARQNRKRGNPHQIIKPFKIKTYWK